MVVIGLGPGGEATATELAKAASKVVGIDERLVGGECPYYGCIPSKMIIRAADVLEEGRRIPGLAGESDVRPDWARSRTGSVTRRPTTGTTRSPSSGSRTPARRSCGARAAGRSAHGRGRTARPTRRSEGVVLNPGTSPAAPPIEGLADTPYWTNRDVLRIGRCPARSP